MIKTHRLLMLLAATVILSAAGCSKKTETPVASTTELAKPAAKPVLPRTPAPENAAVFFVTPKDGDTVSSPVDIEFGASNLTVVAAGNDVMNSGHHHLIINAPLPDLTLPIPANEQYRHFGGGQTTTSIELEPGTYELRMLLGDHLHIPHTPPVISETITITVSE